MDTNDRIKGLRKSLNMSQEEFGKKLGVTRSAIAKIEKAGRNLTEQMAKSICREYNVNYIWLVEGTGDMFSTDKALVRLAEDYKLSDEDIRFIERFINMTATQRLAFHEINATLYKGK